jgi:hypothetical protein
MCYRKQVQRQNKNKQIDREFQALSKSTVPFLKIFLIGLINSKASFSSNEKVPIFGACQLRICSL